MPPRTGSKNKKKQEFRAALRQYCEDKNVDPHFWMVDLLKKPKVAYSLKMQAAKELAQYLEPKLRSTEITGNPDKPLAIDSLSPEQIDQRLAALVAKWQAIRGNGHEVEIDGINTG